jgi:ABC-type transporter lipoprotein component MlaA
MLSFLRTPHPLSCHVYPAGFDNMFATIRQTQELLASFQQLDYYDDLMAQYSSMEAKSEAGDSSNFSLKDYAAQYTQMRDKYLQAAKALKMASGPYKASRDAYVAAGMCKQCFSE